ncbi:MAG TPA: protein kinase [Thermoanaerobaculia bacterium]|nr:protein kinase [Thermoanaerobaculia bacterium]
MSKLRDLLSRDPGRAAAEALLAGERGRAMELFARAGEWQRAIQLAFEMGEDEKLVRYSLMGAFGNLPEGASLEPLRAAELLASRGHHKEAIPVFERARAYLQAGESALVLRQPLRAARYFKQAGAWMQVVRCYEEAGKLREALHAVEEGILSAERTVGGSAAGPDRIKELNMIRADLLLRLGRGDSAAQLLSSLQPSARAAEMLERGGRFSEALQCYLQLGLIEEASRVAANAPDRDRLLAQIYLHTGRAAEAGDLLAQIGLAREAAEAYERARDWGRAAYRWEAAQEPQRAAEAYLQGGRLGDAARCFTAAGLHQRAAEVNARMRDSGSAQAQKKRRSQAVPAVPVRPPAAAKARPAAPQRGGDPLQTARSYLADGNKSGAVAVLMRLRPAEAEFAEGMVLLAPLLLEGGFVEDALDRLRRVPASGTPPHVEVERSYWEGRSLEAMSQNLDAVACFERVAAREPGHRDTRERLTRLRASTPAAHAGRPDHRLTVGSQLAGRYEILAELGRGGMSRVYKARDRELGEIVAIKTMLAPEDGNAEEEARLLREVQICRRISHPNVVRVYDLGRFEGGLFVTMEYIEGRGLDDVIAKEAPLPFARIRAVLSEIASGLHEAHTQGIVHRDLKPANVLVTTGRIKILDFGIASMAGLGSRLTQAGFVMGSPMYMSPDQILGHELDGRSDLYSLGVLAYTLIAGREPFDLVETRVLVLKQLQEPPPDVRRLRPETPQEWVALLGRLLAKQPEERFQSAQEVVTALAKLPV